MLLAVGDDLPIYEWANHNKREKIFPAMLNVVIYISREGESESFSNRITNSPSLPLFPIQWNEFQQWQDQGGIWWKLFIKTFT